MFSWNAACRPCSASDPTTDTVKVQLAEAQTVPCASEHLEDCNKENAAPVEGSIDDALKQREVDAPLESARHARAKEEAHRLETEAEEQRRALAEQHQRQRQRELEEMRAAKEAEQRRQAEEAQKAKREREALEVKRAEEVARKVAEEAKEEARRQAELQRIELQRQADANRVEKWLGENKFKELNHKKSSFMKSTSPLHHAVSQNDAEVVRLLVAAGADRSLKVSNQTALEMAQKLAKKDQKKSYDAVIGALQA